MAMNKVSGESVGGGETGFLRVSWLGGGEFREKPGFWEVSGSLSVGASKPGFYEFFS